MKNFFKNLFQPSRELKTLQEKIEEQGEDIALMKKQIDGLLFVLKEINTSLLFLEMHLQENGSDFEVDLLFDLDEDEEESEDESDEVLEAPKKRGNGRTLN